VGQVSSAAHSNRRMVRPSIGHFKRLLEEAWPNRAYPIKHKLKDSSMMRSFMTLGSLTWGAELNKGPDKSNTAPFPEENAIMTVFEGRP
jgi:hypothetical protein